MRRSGYSTLLLTALVGLVASFAATPARGAVPFADISTPGPMEHIYLGNELSCQVKLAGDTPLSFYPSTVIPGDCGTFLITGGTLYYPKFPQHGTGCSPCTATSTLPSPRTQYTTVSQTPVSGTGTAGDPFTVTTVADAGTTGLRITQTDSYVTGESSYLSEMTVSNSGAATTAKLYHAADCFLAASDNGFGWVPSSDTVFCTVNADNSPPGRIIGFEPADAASAGATYIEALYSNVWSAINGSPFPNTCVCGSSIDNGAGLEWDITVPAGGQVTRKVRTTLSAEAGTISIADRHVQEGSVGGRGAAQGGTPPRTPMRFLISLSAPSGDPVKVDYATADGTAIAGADYDATAGRLTFQPGITSRTITVPVVVDNAEERNETFTVELSNPLGAEIDDATATGKILNDDGPQLILLYYSPKREGVTQRFRAELYPAATYKTVRLDYQTADGDAEAPGDYASTSGTLIFRPGDVEKTARVPTVQDNAQENPETFTMTFSNAINAELLGGPTVPITATIEDDDPD